MKRWAPKLCLVLVAVAGLIWVLATKEEVPMLEASKPSGFYDEPFYLEFRAPAGEIYYTVDGSAPDRSSIHYEGPIYIEDASKRENALSARDDLDSFSGQFVRGEDGNITQIPRQKVDKANIIRVAHYDTTGLVSKELCLCYFVGFQSKTGYGDLQVVSVVVDPYDLTDYETGIFARGKTYDENVPEWGPIWAPGNYSNKGEKWEREADFQLFDGDGTPLYETKCGIRVMGGWHRRAIFKSLNLYARKKYGGSKTFDYDFWGTGLRPHKLTLHSGSGDYYGKVQNMMVADLTRDLDMGVMHYQVCVLFLNGEYWGIYNMTEKYDEEYLAQTYGVDKGDVISAKAEQREMGYQQDFHLYEDAVNFLQSSDMRLEDNYQKFREEFDEQSLLDLFATEIYCARYFDWPNGNTHLWRTVSKSGQRYHDGRWRYLLYDLDSAGLTEDLIDHDTVQYALENCAYFKSLFQNETFRKKLGANILRIGREYLSAERVDAYIASYKARLAEPMKTYFLRFFNSDETRFYERLQSNQDFFDNRLEAMEKILEEHDMLP